MTLSFNSSGHLHRDVELTLDELERHFGTNEWRKKRIRNALKFIEIFYACGCSAVYIGGSFVSTKMQPDDIDLCFDIEDVDYEKLEQAFPDFFDVNKIGKIHRDYKCHILTFDRHNPQFLQMLQQDRYGDPVGLVKINLKEFFYD